MISLENTVTKFGGAKEVLHATIDVGCLLHCKTHMIANFCINPKRIVYYCVTHDKFVCWLTWT